MTINPKSDISAQTLEEFLVNCEFDDEEISAEELAEADIAHQDYQSGRDPGKPLKQLRQEMLEHE